MKKIIILFILCLFASTYFSQARKLKTKEASIIFYNFQNYGLMHKQGKEASEGVAAEKLWRFRLLTGGYDINKQKNSSTTNTENSRIRFDFSVGREHRKSLNNNLNFIYGIELTGGINFNDSKTFIEFNGKELLTGGQKSTSLSTGIIGVIGLNYLIKEKLLIGVELLPSAIYTKTNINPYLSNPSSRTSDSFSFGFGNSSALLSVGLRF